MWRYQRQYKDSAGRTGGCLLGSKEDELQRTTSFHNEFGRTNRFFRCALIILRKIQNFKNHLSPSFISWWQPRTVTQANFIFTSLKAQPRGPRPKHPLLFWGQPKVPATSPLSSLSHVSTGPSQSPLSLLSSPIHLAEQCFSKLLTYYYLLHLFNQFR